MIDPAHAVSFTRTLRLKVKAEAYPWLNKAAIEVNQVWNWANATSLKAARPSHGKPKWLSGFDLCSLSAGAAAEFERIGAQCVNIDTLRRLEGRVADGLRLLPILGACNDRGLLAGVMWASRGNRVHYSVTLTNRGSHATQVYWSQGHDRSRSQA